MYTLDFVHYHKPIYLQFPFRVENTISKEKPDKVSINQQIGADTNIKCIAKKNRPIQAVFK